jgi:hypothetical protein
MNFMLPIKNLRKTELKQELIQTKNQLILKSIAKKSFRLNESTLTISIREA